MVPEARTREMPLMPYRFGRVVGLFAAYRPNRPLGAGLRAARGRLLIWFLLVLPGRCFV